MIGYIMTVLLASAPASGTAQLTIDGETTTHEITECSLEAKNGMPARLLIEDMDITLNLTQVDHVQLFSVIRENANWSASRLFMNGEWYDRG